MMLSVEFFRIYCNVFAASLPKPETDSSSHGLTPAQAKEKASALKRKLLVAIDDLGERLPSNTLDELIDSFGGSEKVAEVCHVRLSVTLLLL